MLRLAALPVLLFLAVVVAFPVGSAADERDRLKVGLQPDGRIVVPTNQILRPAGTQVTFPGRPVDLLLVDGGRTLVAKNMRNLVFIDPATGQVTQTLALPAAAKNLSGAFSAVGLVAAGDRIFASDSQGAVRIAKRNGDGKYAWDGHLSLKSPAVGGAAYPTGMAFQDDKHLWVCSSRGNEVQLFNLESGAVETRVPVGVAPYMPVIVGGDRVYISNWGGDALAKGESPLTTSGTPVKIDPRTNVASTGTVTVIQETAVGWKLRKSIAVGGHPSGMTASKDGEFVYVANANSDTVSVIDTGDEAVVETIDCKPEAKLPFGTGSNAVALSDDGRTLYVANGTGNCVAVVSLGSESGGPPAKGQARPSRVTGMIPTGWYPGAVRLSADDKKLFVANVKGHGALSPRKKTPKKNGKGDGDDPAAPQNIGKNSHDHLGSVSVIDVPEEAKLKEYTESVNANNRLGYSIAGMEPPRPDAKPVPIPERHGEPSVFEHVIYVIKENRTYDQVFGDMKEGNGDPRLCIFGEEVTPNQHKLARDFVLLDNFYCSGVLSADGHSWVNAAYATDYLEKQFGQFTRSYPYEGSDPLAFPVSGFLWDNALAHKKTFRNYGEFVKSGYEPRGTKWSDVYADYVNGTSKVKITATPNLRSLDKYSHPNYPGFPLTTPDVYRAKIFLDELKEFERTGTFPNLVYVFLPADHTNGTRPGSPTPRAMVADGDLALGQIVEAVSKSKFWPKTCILVTEDDPQNGFDHVDGHRTVGMVISPYTKRKAVDSTCYNQTGLVKTIELILGLPPMTQLDLSATPLRGCFTDKPDLTPYTAVKNQIALDEMNKPLGSLSGKARQFALESMEEDFEVEDRADEDTLNRILWFSVRGDEPFPGDRK